MKFHHRIKASASIRSVVKGETVRTVAVLAIALLLPGPSQVLAQRSADAQALAGVDIPTWTVGEIWTYEAPWGLTTFAVMSVGGPNVVMMQTVSSRGSVRKRFDATHLGKTEPAWLPDFVWFDFPLTPDKSYSRVFSESGQPWHFSLHVGKMEQVTVPAGRFSAIRVDVRVCGTGGSCGGSSLWYAPAAKWFVRATWDRSLWWDERWRGASMDLVSVTLKYDFEPRDEVGG